MTQRKARAKSASKVGTGHTPPAQTQRTTILRPSWKHPRVGSCVDNGRPKNAKTQAAQKACLMDTKAEIEPIRAAAKERAEKAVKIMSEQYDIEDDYAKNALQTAVEIMAVPGETRERLAAARLVLDFTKSKPASKQEVTIGKAEEFLASLLDEDENGSEATTGSQASSD